MFFGSKLNGKKRVFLDYASATPLRSEVAEVMRAYDRAHFANASALYIEAREAKDALDAARREAAGVLNCAKEKIIFTSGGTEANNIAVQGAIKATKERGVARPHIITSAIEHSSVREIFLAAQGWGCDVTFLTPDKDGIISAKQVSDALRKETVLVSIMYVNNEIGTVEPVREIAQAISIKLPEAGPRASRPLFHVDACQAALFYSLDVSTLGVDLMTLDGLKIGGPRASGILYVGHDALLAPIMYGGGQERRLRSGTEDVAKALGLARALTLAKAERKELSERLEKLRDYFIDEILKISRTVIDISAHQNGSRKHRAPNNINVCFPGVDAEYLVVALDTYGVAASYSSSCLTLKEDSSSYVVEVLDPQGTDGCKDSSVRFTLGRETTKRDIDFALKVLVQALGQVNLSK